MTPQEITLDLNPSFSRLKMVHCSQYDNNVRQITVKMQDGGTDVDVSTYTIYIEGTKPDKHGFSYALADIGTVSGNTVTFYVQTQMCAVPGLTLAEVVLTNGTDRIGSANFNLAVERAGLAEDIDISETDIPAYVDGAQQAAAEAEQAKDDAVSAKETAVSAAETAQGVLESIPEDYSDLSNDVDDLKSAFESYKFDELFSELKVSENQNIYNKSTTTDGFIAANGNISSSTIYCYSEKIAVEEGKTYTFWVLIRGNVESMNSRFTCAYDSDGNAVVSAGSNSGISSYTVPSGITHVVLSVEQNAKHLFMMVEGTTQPTKLLPYNLEHYVAKQSFVSDAVMSVIRGTEFFKRQISTADANTEYILTNVANKKNCSYSFSGTFSSFTSLEIGHGKTESGANYLIIDDEKITSYKPDGTAYATYTHGLTITDFIRVSIKCADTKAARATVTIQTNGGYASVGNVIFFGCNGNIYFKCGQTTENAIFVYNIMDLRKDVYVFGDSYISLADDKRWTNYAIENADNNMLLCGFAGASAQDVYPSFTTLISMKSPKYVCWLLGMNNADATNNTDTNWVEATSQVIAYCHANGIIPILATIPNTPTVRNIHKNAWVKASGERYVDFAKAVGAESEGSSWYTGMLSSDNIHPTAEGAKALWLQMRMDVPEIMQPTTV